MNINSRGPRPAPHQRRRNVAQPLDSLSAPAPPSATAVLDRSSFAPDPLFPARQPDAPVLWAAQPVPSSEVDHKHHPFSALNGEPHLTVPHNNDYTTKPRSQEWFIPSSLDTVTSPSDETDVEMSPLAENGLPTYSFDGFHNTSVDYKAFTIPEDELPSQAMYDPFNMADSKIGQSSIEPYKLSSTAPPQSAAGKPRSAHRKAIEEKSSIKRKNAERRLSDIITHRLKGTFVPGLANQLNQAAELLERDHAKIERLEAENRRLEAENRRLLAQSQYQQQDIKYYPH